MPADVTAASRAVHRLARRWLLQRAAAWMLVAVSVSLTAWLMSGRVNLVALATLFPVIALFYLHRARPINALTVARHLDRSAPALEESTVRLLEPETAGDPLQRMQRRRVATAFAALPSLPRMAFPATRMVMVTSLACLAVSLLVVLLPRTAPTTTSAVGPAAAPTERVPLQLRSVTLAWTPPAYLTRPRQTSSLGSAVVEEGSVVEWHVTAAGAAQVRIVDLLGDTLVARASGDSWMARAPVSRARVWRAEALDDTGHVVRSETYLLGVTLDRAPVIAIVAPPGRTEMEWSEPHRVVVRAVVNDDYGIGSTALLATVAAGRGEGVKFREQRLPLERESASGTQQVVSAMVDLDALQVAPGDEVYLAVEASDRRAPIRQVARSETVFLSIRDTLDPISSDFGGIAVDIEPEFFRSQRQIILDTEALLADVRSGHTTEPLARAMDIGYDQYLLRVRYGEIAGQEDEANGTDPTAVITEADLMHMHDSEDNATLLAATVKATLQGALAAMWEAEKQLRTGNPSAALPHEYRALVALEQIRQAQRAYVKRIGFEPPAIDVERTRLTKQAKDVAALTTRSLAVSVDAGGELRAALAALHDTAGPLRTAAIEAAARQLAQQAIADPSGRHLTTLSALRRIVDGPDSAALRAEAMRGLLAALPAPRRPIVPASR